MKQLTKNLQDNVMNQTNALIPANIKPMSRLNIIITGLIGVFCAVLLTIFCILAVLQEWFPIFLSSGLYVWGFFLFLAFFSVVEIPVMIFGMRNIATNDNPKAAYIVLFTNAVYTLFAAVYAAPFILLTGGIWAGSALASLTLARFASSVFFLPYDQ